MKFYKKVCLFMLAFDLVFSEAAVAEANSPVSISSTEEWEVLEQVNRERASNGLEPLSLIGNLQKANDIRAAELYQSFSHARPDGSSCFTVLQGVNYNTAGENIAAGYATPEDVMDAWMNSTGHKANILDGKFSHIGVGHYYNRSGTYHHYWSQLFIGSCNPISISVEGSKAKTYKYGMTVADMDRVLRVNCMHGTSFVPLTDYMCSGYNFSTAGRKNIRVNYRGLYTMFKVKIAGINIRKARIFNVKNKKYNGKTQKQNPKVMLNGKTLVKGRDYTVSYKNNRKKGKATMMIKGKGKYSGTIKKKFKISRK